MRRRSRARIEGAFAAALALAACGRPDPAPPPAPGGVLTAELQSVVEVDGQAAYPVMLRNDGTGPVREAKVACRFVAGDGSLLFVGEVSAKTLAPRQAVTRRIIMPMDIARQIRGLRCRPSAG